MAFFGTLDQVSDNGPGRLAHTVMLDETAHRVELNSHSAQQPQQRGFHHGRNMGNPADRAHNHYRLNETNREDRKTCPVTGARVPIRFERATEGFGHSKP